MSCASIYAPIYLIQKEANDASVSLLSSSLQFLLLFRYCLAYFSIRGSSYLVLFRCLFVHIVVVRFHDQKDYNPDFLKRNNKNWFATKDYKR